MKCAAKRKQLSELENLLPLRTTVHTLPLLYLVGQNLHAYAHKTYATVEIHPNLNFKGPHPSSEKEENFFVVC